MPKKPKQFKGMTFIELIVVLGIFAAVASTVLFNYGDFSGNIRLQNLAQDVALLVKRAQTEAVSGRLPTLSSSQSTISDVHIPSDWKPSYGVAFTTTSASFLGNNEDGHKFIYYFNSANDTNAGEIVKDFYDFEVSTYSGCGNDAESECLDEISITSGDVVDEICLNFTTIDPNNGSCDGDTEDHVYISFTRPRSNANIFPEIGGNPTTNAYIRLTSPQNKHKYISVWSSGYISVQ